MNPDKTIRLLISERLHAARLAAKMTYPELETLSKVKRSNLAIYENFPKYGKSPSVEALYRIARSVGKRIGYFFGEEDTHTPLANGIDLLYAEGLLSSKGMVAMKEFFDAYRERIQTAESGAPSASAAGSGESGAEEAERKSVELFLLGQIAASSINALEHFDNGEYPDETIEAPSRLVGAGDRYSHYALRVTGDSMERDNIRDGDLAVVRSQKNINPGDIGVCVWRDGDNGMVCTLKRLIVEGNRIVLRSSAHDKAAHPDVVNPPDLQIKGRFMGAIRKEG